MGKRGNPNIAKYRFTTESARKAQQKGVEVRAIRYSMFKSVRSIIETTAPDDLVNDKIAKFWSMRGVPRNKITPMMAELTPTYANAIASGDIQILERLYRLFGLAFDSNREHNINDSVGDTEEKSFEINYIVDGVKQEPPQLIECEQVEQNGL